MVEESAGCFIKLSKKYKMPVTRYFILDKNRAILHYYENSAQLRRVINKQYSWEQAMKMLDSGKSLHLKDIKLGPKAQSNFSLTINNKELMFYPWENESVHKLYSNFEEINIKNCEGSHKPATNCTENDQSAEKLEMSTLGNGNIYYGECNELGLPHGNNAKEFCEDGSIFYGSFRRGKWHGAGCIVNSNLDMVHKEYINGELCGI